MRHLGFTVVGLMAGSIAVVWEKISTRPEPLEIETAGGVMGIKG